ncbi:RF-1 domain-domain-containing protein [Syncephalastrum racemosum]|uniref:RF-1 domain-domain-containing protein n=1 Tax=Syncephalastrum racemosum TaxID=13706 RepID=A0A1X2H8E5_SYNRA|nr:RF-1 domain-domain-containing protein [Syncephalastrum racemosum]
MLNRFLSLPSSPWQRLFTSAAAKAAKERQKIVLEDKDLVEKFIKGWGPGGQVINKRVSCVELKHIPTGIIVKCQQSRSLQDNRGIARKLLREKLDDLINGKNSKNAVKAAKSAKAKAKRAARAKKKYGNKKEDDVTDTATKDPSPASDHTVNTPTVPTE